MKVFVVESGYTDNKNSQFFQLEEIYQEYDKALEKAHKLWDDVNLYPIENTWEGGYVELSDEDGLIVSRIYPKEII